jgi:hypothetical protein
MKTLLRIVGVVVVCLVLLLVLLSITGLEPRSVAQRESGYDAGQRLVVHRPSLHGRGPDSQPVSDSSLGNRN